MIKLFLGSTFFSSLILGKAPGTVSSVFVFLALFFLNPFSLELKLALLLFILVCHFYCFAFFMAKYKSDDPALYTLDEALAMVLLNIPFSKPDHWIAALFVFRFFDIIKPLGIKRVEKASGVPASVRNIADDLVAALYTFLVITAYDYF